MIVKAQFRDQRVTKRLNHIRRNGDDLTKPLNEIGEIMMSSIEQNFLVGGRFESGDSFRGGTNRWADLAESTKEQRRKKGTWPGQILQRTQAGLASATSYTVNGNDLELGNNKVYARIQQKGGEAGRGHKVKIRARPYIVVQDEDVDDMVDVLDKHIMKE